MRVLRESESEFYINRGKNWEVVRVSEHFYEFILLRGWEKIVWIIFNLNMFILTVFFEF